MGNDWEEGGFVEQFVNVTHEVYTFLPELYWDSHHERLRIECRLMISSHHIYFPHLGIVEFK
jgi:hypothetical protein